MNFRKGRCSEATASAVFELPHDVWVIRNIFEDYLVGDVVFETAEIWDLLFASLAFAFDGFIGRFVGHHCSPSCSAVLEFPHDVGEIADVLLDLFLGEVEKTSERIDGGNPVINRGFSTCFTAHEASIDLAGNKTIPEVAA